MLKKTLVQFVWRHVPLEHWVNKRSEPFITKLV